MHVKPSLFENEPDPALPDHQLVQLAISGNEPAWRALVERHAALVYSVLAGYGLSESDREDAFQGVFTALVEGLHQIRDVASLPKWLITTTHRTAWKLLRVSRRTNDDSDLLEDPCSPPLELALQWERQHLVRMALERLGPPCGQLLHELYFSSNAAEYPEIARRLDMPVGSIGPTRGRCFRKLVQILRRMDPELFE